MRASENNFILSSGWRNRCRANLWAVLGPIPGNCSNWSINFDNGLVKPLRVQKQLTWM